MGILFGHPSGNPNSHHAALAHFEAGRLAAFCVAWMPSLMTLKILSAVPGWHGLAKRLARRRFEPLACAPKIQGRLGELRRLVLRASGQGNEGLAYEANDWLMRTMASACRRMDVSAVHSYEDCSLWQFEAAKRQGKPCIYDMPIGYSPAWKQIQLKLVEKYCDWLPSKGLTPVSWERPEQKRREMELADLVLAPSTFVRETILRFHPNKKVALVPYGVDLDFWHPPPIGRRDTSSNRFRFIFAGQCSLRKGTPMLLDAWDKAGLKDAELILVGSWLLAPERKSYLPSNVILVGPVSSAELLNRYHEADVFVFPSYFEGFALALLEAMACGLPVISTPILSGMELLSHATGREINTGDTDALVEALCWFSANREKIPRMRTAARSAVEKFTWENYRRAVNSECKVFT